MVRKWCIRDGKKQCQIKNTFFLQRTYWKQFGLQMLHTISSSAYANGIIHTHTVMLTLIPFRFQELITNHISMLIFHIISRQSKMKQRHWIRLCSLVAFAAATEYDFENNNRTASQENENWKWIQYVYAHNFFFLFDIRTSTAHNRQFAPFVLVYTEYDTGSPVNIVYKIL